MIKASSRIKILAPAEQIGSIAFNPQRDSDWLSGVLSSKVLNGSEMTIGAKVFKEAEYFGKRYDAEFEVIEFKPSHVLRMRTDSPMAFEVLFQIESGADGSVFEMSLSALEKLPVPLPEFIVKRALEESIGRDLKKLKAIVESNG